MNLRSIFFAGLIMMMASCVGVYFSTPQPIDSKNLYTFPKKFRGSWTIEEVTVNVEKNFFRHTENSERKISIKELDSSSYLLKNNKIYHINKKSSELSRGFHYEILNDSIVYMEPMEFEIILGKNNFLRKLKKDYILNVMQEDQWWELILLKKDITGTIYVHLLDYKDLEQFSNYDHLYSFEADYSRYDYLEANWTKKKLLEMLDRGMFSDTLFILDPNGRIRLKDE